MMKTGTSSFCLLTLYFYVSVRREKATVILLDRAAFITHGYICIYFCFSSSYASVRVYLCVL